MKKRGEDYLPVWSRADHHNQAIRDRVYHSLWRKANARNFSFETIYGGQFSSSTQLIILNYPVILSHQHSKTGFFRNLTLYSFYYMWFISLPMIIRLQLLLMLLKNIAKLTFYFYSKANRPRSSIVTETFFGKISFISFILLRDNSDKNTVAFIYGLVFSTPFPPAPVFPNGSIPPWVHTR